MSTAVREARWNTHNTRDTYDGTEPVYVSLQRRRNNDRNSMYMTLEDPNNPESKIVMPKEVFDEFYNTLTIKKT